jgi:hypothetical protein
MGQLEISRKNQLFFSLYFEINFLMQAKIRIVQQKFEFFHILVYVHIEKIYLIIDEK